jgi:hypothetical protein
VSKFSNSDIGLNYLRHEGENTADAISPASLTRCENSLDLFLRHRGSPFSEIEAVIAGDHKCLLAHCIRAALVVSTDGDPNVLNESVRAIEAAHSGASPLMRRHASAARAWLNGNDGLAVESYGAIVVDEPRDILALVAAHALDFRLGQRKMLRDRVAKVLSHWGPVDSSYASILSMYAFGLVENGQYRRAERSARTALAIDAQHLGAIHVISHVMEMQGRAQEGLEFLASTQPAWIESNNFAVHLAWHRGLFHLDVDDPRSALAVYDSEIARASSSDMCVLADASALLWRLQLRNIDVGDRWRLLADRWETLEFTGVRPFYIIHATMAFATAARGNAVARALKALPQINSMKTQQLTPEEALALPFSEALLAFVRKDYGAAIESLTCVRKITDRCGGSLAQCDLIHLTFTEAALRASKVRLARELVLERATQKPTSVLNTLLRKRLGKLVAFAQMRSRILGRRAKAFASRSLLPRPSYARGTL